MAFRLPKSTVRLTNVRRQAVIIVLAYGQWYITTLQIMHTMYLTPTETKHSCRSTVTVEDVLNDYGLSVVVYNRGIKLTCRAKWPVLSVCMDQGL